MTICTISAIETGASRPYLSPIAEAASAPEIAMVELIASAKLDDAGSSPPATPIPTMNAQTAPSPVHQISSTAKPTRGAAIDDGCAICASCAAASPPSGINFTAIKASAANAASGI